MRGWDQARQAAGLVKPAAEWRERLAQAIWDTGEAVLVGVFTCPAGQPLDARATTRPREAARSAESALFGRLLPRIERGGFGVAQGRKLGCVAYDPIAPGAANTPRLAADVQREVLHPAGAAGLVNVFLFDGRAEVVGWISVGTRRPSAEALQLFGPDLGEVARIASQAICAAQDLASACGATLPEPPRASLAELSRREREIARLVAAGFSDLNIGAQLGITENTVGVHLRSIYAKLGVHSRVELLLQSSARVRDGAEEREKT